jgi:hypothetical protein
MTPQRLSEDAVRAATDAVLHEEPFVTQEGLQEALFQLWERFRDSMIGLSLTHPVLYGLALVVLLGVTLLLVWHIVFTARLGLRAIRARAPAALAPDDAGDPRAAVAEARHALDRGDSRRAVELAYEAAADYLSRAMGVVRAGRTPRGYHRELASQLPHSSDAALAELVGLHEQACYAGVRPDPGWAARAVELADELVAREIGAR